MEEDEDEGPFRYRSGVRVIAIFDTVNNKGNYVHVKHFI